MTRDEFIFSNNPVHRITRHLVFWLVYSTFFYLQSVTPEVIPVLYHSNAYYFGWVSVYCYLPVCIFSVYVFIYFLLPVYLQKKKYLQFAAITISLYVFFNLVDYQMAALFFKATCHCDEKKLTPLFVFSYGNNNAFLAVAIGCIATGIKFTKEWYIQQKRVLEIRNQKTKKELYALITSIHPGFISHSLDRLEANIQADPSSSEEMVLMFSEILSYILYDCDTDFIPLHDELKAVGKYILLEQMKMKSRYSISFEQTGNIDKDIIIVPSLLLSFLQNCLTMFYSRVDGCAIIKIEANSVENNFSFSLNIRHDGGLEREQNKWHEISANFRERLQQLYPEKHKLEINCTDNEIILALGLSLVNRTNPVDDLYGDFVKTGMYETI